MSKEIPDIDVALTDRQFLDEYQKEHAKCKKLLQEVDIGVVGQPLSDRVKEAVKLIKQDGTDRICAELRAGFKLIAQAILTLSEPHEDDHGDEESSTVDDAEVRRIMELQRGKPCVGCSEYGCASIGAERQVCLINLTPERICE